VVEDDLGADGAGVRFHLHHQLGALDHRSSPIQFSTSVVMVS
jgi:hypothetical protein